MNSLRLIQISVFLSLVFTFPALSKIELPVLIEKLQTTYDGTKDFKATFTQLYRPKIKRKDEKSTGQVSFKKPGLMRWDYKKPSEKSFIVSSSVLWLVEPKEKLVLKDACFKQDGLTSSIAFLGGEGKLKEEFDAEWFTGTFGSKRDHHVLLKPKKPNSVFKKLILVVDPKTFRVKQSVVVDLQSNINRFIFTSMTFNKGLKAKDFEFEPPTSYTVNPIPGTCEEPAS